MNDLIKIDTDESGKETINARDLHEFINSKQDFSNWIVNRINQYGFDNGYDFTIIPLKSNGGRPSKEYHITIDMAKHLAMVERNEKGREIRQWFIDREEKLRKQEMSVTNPPKLPNFNDPVAAARAWADAKEQELKAKLELEEAQPKIEFHDKVGDSKGLYSIGQTAKLLGTGRNRLFSWLREKGIFFGIEPYQTYINRGYFTVKTDSINDHVQKQAFTTPKGLQWLQSKYKINNNIQRG